MASASVVLTSDTSGSVTVTVPSGTSIGTTTLTLPTSGGTIQTSGSGYTANGVAYASSTSALTTGSALSFDGTTFTVSQANSTYGIVAKSTSATTSARTYYTIKDSASSDLAYYGFVTSSDLCVWNGQNTNTRFLNNGAEKMLLTNVGNLGLGVTPTTWYNDTKAIQFSSIGAIWSSGSAGYTSFSSNYNYAASGADLYLANGFATQMLTRSGGFEWYTSTSNSSGAGATCSFNRRAQLDNLGNFSVVGALSKGSGSFCIEHPLPTLTETHELVHSFIEGPQADLIYRGKVTLVNGLATVNIDTVSSMTDGTFVILCRDVQCFTTNESDWTPVKGFVSGNILTIEAQDNTSTANISWMVIGERQDKHMYDTDWTDENGKVIVEPLKKPIEPLHKGE